MNLGKVRYESKYLAINNFYKENKWSINWMCKQFSISRASYYKWLNRNIPEKEQENIKFSELICKNDDRFYHLREDLRMAIGLTVSNTLIIVKTEHIEL